MKHILRAMAYQLTRKKVSEKRISSLHISVRKRDVFCFNLSTNPILSFDYHGERCYFRACPRIMDRKRYFLQSIDDFFVSLDHLGIDRRHFKQDFPVKLNFSDEEIRRFKAYLKDKAEDRRFLKMLYNMDLISQKIRFSIWTEQTYDQPFFSAFGLEDRPQRTDDISVYFIWCIRSAAVRYRTISIARGREYSHFNAVRAVASRIVAESLGLGHMITSARFCTLHMDDGSSVFGLLSDTAPGTRMLDSSIEPSGMLQRELGNLFLLDLISFQVDHGPNNYNVDLDGTVCAFDNDNPMTFFPRFTISNSFGGCSPFIDDNGIVFRPYLDRNVAERILRLDVHGIKKELKPYLNFLQVAALSHRIRLIRKAIQRTQKESSVFLIDGDNWDLQTVARELSGDYGATYLTKALRSE